MSKHKRAGRRRLSACGGMTLVEIVAAAAIVALTAAMLTLCFGAAMGLVRRGAGRQRGADAAYAAAETGQPASSSPGGVSFEAGGRVYTVPGTYFESRDPESGAVFYSFAPGP